MKKVFFDFEDENDNKNITNEVKVMKDINHPNIIRINNSFIEQEIKYIIMEYA